MDNKKDYKLYVNGELFLETNDYGRVKKFYNILSDPFLENHVVLGAFNGKKIDGSHLFVQNDGIIPTSKI